MASLKDLRENEDLSMVDPLFVQDHPRGLLDSCACMTFQEDARFDYWVVQTVLDSRIRRFVPHRQGGITITFFNAQKTRIRRHDVSLQKVQARF